MTDFDRLCEWMMKWAPQEWDCPDGEGTYVVWDRGMGDVTGVMAIDGTLTPAGAVAVLEKILPVNVDVCHRMSNWLNCATYHPRDEDNKDFCTAVRDAALAAKPWVATA